MHAKMMDARAWILLIIGATAFTTCAKKPVKPAAPVLDSPSTGVAATPVGTLGPAIPVRASLLAKPLTSSGDSSDPRFSPDGSRVIFISRSRANHRQAQVYELHLGRMTEKRVTFHDGDDVGPVYTPDGEKILFSSTTDEIKEPPYVIDRLMKNYDPEQFQKRVKEKPFLEMSSHGYELYQQSLHGRAIERMTRSPGFDGDVDIESKRRRIVYSSARGSNGTHLFLQSGKATSRLTEGPTINRGPRFSRDGKSLVWSSQTESRQDESQILVAQDPFRKPRALVEGGSLNVHPAWHPNGTVIVFSSKRAGKSFNLFSVDATGGCVRRLTEADFDQIQPAFSPDGKQLVFTGLVDGRSHIFQVDYSPPADCWTAPLAADSAVR